MANETRPKARLVDTATLLAVIVPAYLDPVPTKRSLTTWLHAAGINHLKANPGAKRGGGKVWWHASQVERLLRERAGLVGGAQ